MCETQVMQTERKQNFTRLVLGSIEADFCDQVVVGKLLTRSTQQSVLQRSLLLLLLSFVFKLLTKIASREKKHSFVEHNILRLGERL